MTNDRWYDPYLDPEIPVPASTTNAATHVWAICPRLEKTMKPFRRLISGSSSVSFADASRPHTRETKLSWKRNGESSRAVQRSNGTKRNTRKILKKTVGRILALDERRDHGDKKVMSRAIIREDLSVYRENREGLCVCVCVPIGEGKAIAETVRKLGGLDRNDDG